jgi:hypothetical protein
MFRTAEFKPSRRYYAADPATFKVTSVSPSGDSWCEVTAVWFRRKSGVTAACTGRLWGHAPGPVDAADFLAKWTDGRYGGDCAARWDGRTLWSLLPEDERARAKELLTAMLATYPAIPDGYSGWWHF